MDNLIRLPGQADAASGSQNGMNGAKLRLNCAKRAEFPSETGFKLLA
jgi:hypothetical protein